jgi:acetoacetyl-CoA synthetase
MTDTDGTILWRPSPDRAAASAMARFAAATSPLHGLAADDVPGLQRWSIEHPAAFWSALWDFSGIIGDKGQTVIAPGSHIAGTQFFPEARFNYTETVLRDPDDRLALIAHRDDGSSRRLTRRQLHALVSRIAAALTAEGIQPGDRIAAIVTNDVESIAFYLASAAIGAVWASCSPDFGPEAAADRLAQIEPKLLLAVPDYHYAGKHLDITASIAAVAAAPSIGRIITCGAPRGDYGKPAISLEDWLGPHPAGPIAYRRLPFDAPMAVLFSSGTTGKPKGIVHKAGGLLLKHMSEHILHCDVGPTDRLFYFTTCGWMMWNWQISGLATGATLISYDGSPFHPDKAHLPDLIDSEAITIFGTSAKYIDSLAKAGCKPRQTHRLSSLRTVLSTGSPLIPSSFDYIYGDWKPDLHLASISGGTDICGCFLGGNPLLPVRRGEMHGPILGLDIAALDPETGAEMPDGEAGELVCRNAHPSMPLGFWNDPDKSRYRAAYFEPWADIWRHGDRIEKTASGGYVIHGRSDTTLNPGGVRIGTAELYRQVESIPEIEEAIAVGQDWQGDQRIVLFVRLRESVPLDAALIDTIRRRIRSGATPRHVPAKILAVPAIPRTRSGKISEIAVRDTLHGRRIANLGALANPEALEHFRDRPELQD